MALRKRMTALALTGAAVLGLGVAAAGPAAAIDRVDTSTCNARSDFFTLWNYPPKVCFAGDGYVSVGIYDVYQVDSGNNSGSYGGVWGGVSTTVYFSSWRSRTFSPNLNVTYINVTGR